MGTLTQFAAVTSLNLRSLPQRWVASGVLVIGVAGVVGVLVSLMALATGLASTLSDTGDPSRAIVLRKAANTEGFSNIDPAWLAAIDDAPGVLRTADGKPAVSAERVVGATLRTRSRETEAGITVRGTDAAASLVHPEWHIVAGRMFRPGLREIVVGTAAAAEFSGVDIGRRVWLGDNDWTVVGRFSSNGDSHESDALTDARTLMSALGWTTYSAVTVRLESPAAFDRFSHALLANPSLEVDVQREQDYYRQQSQSTAALLYLIGNVVGTIMAIGATLTAMNTLYSAVAARTAEIAILRAIGFGAGGVVAAVLTEALLLSIIGALLGAALAWLLFNGYSASTSGGPIDSQVVFHLTVKPSLFVTAIAWAVVIGLIGGLLPAIRAARLSVTTALRRAR
jgi:putative ABC transport system permease protein